MFAKTFLAALALATTALATTTPDQSTGQSIIKNKCSFPVYITSVDHETHPTIAIAAGGIWSEPQRYDPVTGVSIKIGTTADALWEAKPIIQFAYTAKPDAWTYYDISPSWGFDPLFNGQKIVLEGSAANSPKIIWNGTPELSQNTKSYDGITDLILSLCT